jgi:hypothetical protein
MATLTARGGTRPHTAARFVPSGFVPLTMFVSPEDLDTLRRRANSDDVVAFLTGHIRRKLLHRRAGKGGGR